jgi:hypothetical protein
MKSQIIDVLGFAASIYIFGLLFVLLMVATGYQGGDMLTEHYRGVLQSIISLF